MPETEVTREIIGISTTYGAVGLFTLFAFMAVVLYSFVPRLHRMDGLAHVGVLATSAITSVVVQFYTDIAAMMGSGMAGEETAGVAIFIILLVSILVMIYNLSIKSELLQKRRR